MSGTIPEKLQKHLIFTDLQIHNNILEKQAICKHVNGCYKTIASFIPRNPLYEIIKIQNTLKINGN